MCCGRSARRRRRRRRRSLPCPALAAAAGLCPWNCACSGISSLALPCQTEPNPAKARLLVCFQATASALFPVLHPEPLPGIPLQSSRPASISLRLPFGLPSASLLYQHHHLPLSKRPDIRFETYITHNRTSIAFPSLPARSTRGRQSIADKLDALNHFLEYEVASITTFLRVPQHHRSSHFTQTIPSPCFRGSTYGSSP